MPYQNRNREAEVGLRYYTFLDVDGLDCLKDRLTVRASKDGEVKIRPQSSRSELATSDPIYLNSRGCPIVAESVGVIFRASGRRQESTCP